MNTRTYRMGARADAMQATRERILDVTAELLLERWYDELTVAEVAARAGVSPQTVINHFGGKDDLAVAASERLSEQIDASRSTGAGDLRATLRGLVADYELNGDMTIRALALEQRVPSLSRMLDVGRAGHRAWVERSFDELLPARGAARERRVVTIVAVTDAYFWKLLRRDQGLTQEAVVDVMAELLEGLEPQDKRRRRR